MRTRNQKEEKGGWIVRGKNNPENLAAEIIKLNPIEFLGVCKIVGVQIYQDEDVECAQPNEGSKEPKARDFYEIWQDLCDKIESMNRIRRRNLGKLVYAATKKGKEK